MNHKHWRKYFILYLDGELPDKARAHLKAHLLVCLPCQEELTLLQGHYQKARVLEKNAVPPFLWTRVRTRLNHENSTRRSWYDQLIPRLQPIAVVMLLMIAVFCGYFLGNVREPVAVLPEWPSEQIVQQAFSADVFEPNPPQSLGRAVMIIYTNPDEVVP